MKRWIDQLHSPVDPVRFLAMTRVYQQAARIPLPKPKGAGYYLKDMPINRGMLAVVGAMRKAGDSQEALTGTMGRLMLVGEIFDAREYFGDYILPGTDGEGSIEVADVLMKAAAVARILPLGGGARFDLADVLAHAQRFDAVGSPTAPPDSSRTEA